MKSRFILSAGIVALAAASQAAVTFNVLNATTNGVGGVIGFTPVVAGNTISGNVSRTATGIPASLNLDFKVSTNVGYISSVTYDLYFQAPTSGELKGTFTYNPVGTGPGGVDADLAGGVQDLTGTTTYAPITSLGSLSGGLIKVSRTINIAAYVTPKWHFVLDDAWRNATLVAVDSNVNVVPEPASMAALGLGALGLLRRRRKA